jgi:orotate phosphoribosyltransferase
VSVDRQERGTTSQGGLSELTQTFGMPAFAIVTLDEIVAHLSGRSIDGRVWIDEPVLERMQRYRAEWGAA